MYIIYTFIVGEKYSKDKLITEFYLNKNHIIS